MTDSAPTAWIGHPAEQVDKKLVIRDGRATRYYSRRS
jgi:hypothetical protein